MSDELEELKRRVAELEAAEAERQPKPVLKSEPYQPPDYTANASMGPGAMAEMAKAVPDRLVADLVNDFRRGPPQLAPMVAPAGPEPVRGSGWVDPAPLRPPGGIQYVDQIAEHFAALDKAELARKLGK